MQARAWFSLLLGACLSVASSLPSWADTPLTPGEDRLHAIRQSLFQLAMSGPTEVRATSWVDGQGVLRDSASFSSGAVVRGVKVLAYTQRMDQEPSAALHLAHQQFESVGPCRQQSHERAQPWHQMQLEVSVSSQLPVSLRYSANQLALLTRQYLRHRSQQGPIWRLSETYQSTSTYEQALLGRGEQYVPWRLQLRIEPASDGVNGASTVALRWDVSRRLDRVVLHQQWQSLAFEALPPGNTLERLSPVMTEQLQQILQSFAQTLESKLACIPPQFEVLNVQSGRLRIAGGQTSGLRVGDQLVVADRQKIPARTLEPRALDQLALAEVQSVSGYYAELKQIAGPKLAGAAQWVALAYTP
jgi:hypothetical protein